MEGKDENIKETTPKKIDILESSYAVLLPFLNGKKAVEVFKGQYDNDFLESVDRELEIYKQSKK